MISFLPVSSIVNLIEKECTPLLALFFYKKVVNKQAMKNTDQNKTNQSSEPVERGGKTNQQENLNQGKHERKNDPVAQQGSGTEQTPGQSQSQQSGERQSPVTNQDEQRKTTNAGKADEPIGEKEKEGE